MKNKKVLIDTSAWILYLQGSAFIKEKIKQIILEDKALTSEIIIFEILRGAKSAKEYKVLHQDFMALEIISLTNEVWSKAFEIGFSLRKAGINVPTTDILIASIAISNNVRLMHKDKHFPLIAEQFTLELIGV